MFPGWGQTVITAVSERQKAVHTFNLLFSTRLTDLTIKVLTCFFPESCLTFRNHGLFWLACCFLLCRDVWGLQNINMKSNKRKWKKLQAEKEKKTYITQTKVQLNPQFNVSELNYFFFKTTSFSFQELKCVDLVLYHVGLLLFYLSVFLSGLLMFWTDNMFKTSPKPI